MTKLNQIIAVANGKKTACEAALTAVYHEVQKPDLFTGISRVYVPSNEDGETLPSEEKLPQANVKTSIDAAKEAITSLIDTVATQDKANTQAKADVVVDNVVVIADVPVTHLLFLEKQLKDIRTFVGKLPTLPVSERWEFDASQSMYRTPVTQTNRSVKVLKNHVRAEATDKHPAQVDVYNEDVKVGTWNTTKFSTCLPVNERNATLKRIDALIEAVKTAREEANSIEVTSVKYGESVLNFVFGK